MNITEGDWIHDQSNESIGTIMTTDGVPIAQAQIVGSLGHQSKETIAARKANADLLAASKDLLAALRDTLQWTHRAKDLEVSGSMVMAQEDAIKKAMAAIAKAEGRTEV